MATYLIESNILTLKHVLFFKPFLEETDDSYYSKYI